MLNQLLNQNTPDQPIILPWTGQRSPLRAIISIIHDYIWSGLYVFALLALATVGLGAASIRVNSTIRTVNRNQISKEVTHGQTSQCNSTSQPTNSDSHLRSRGKRNPDSGYARGGGAGTRRFYNHPQDQRKHRPGRLPGLEPIDDDGEQPQAAMHLLVLSASRAITSQKSGEQRVNIGTPCNSLYRLWQGFMRAPSENGQRPKTSMQALLQEVYGQENRWKDSFHLRGGLAMGKFTEQLIRTIQTYRLADRYPDFSQLTLMIERGLVSEGMARAFLYSLQDFVEDQKDYPNLLHRPPTEEQWYARGRPDIELGSLVEAPELRFGINLTGGQHGGFIGMTNSGKTVAARNLILKIHEWNLTHPEFFVSMIIIDPKGGDYADVKSILGECCRYFSVHDGLRVGTNGPENVPPRIWINHLSSVCFAARAGLKASSTCMANQIEFHLKALNPQLRLPLASPDYSLLLESAKSVPLTLFAAKPDYEKSYIQKLEQVAGEECFRTFNGLNLQRDIVDKKLHAVIDTCGLGPPWVKLLLDDTLMSQLLVGRQYAFRKQQRIDTIVIRDEADAEVTAEAERAIPDGGMSPAAQTEKQLREAGLAQFLSLSAMGPVSRQVLTNMVNTFVFRVKDAHSLQEASRALLLPPGAEAILPTLENGECLLRTDNGWPHAVLGRFDDVPTSRLPRPERFDTHSYMPAKGLDDLPQVRAALDKRISEHNQAKLRQMSRKQGDRHSLSKHAHALLHAIATHLWAPAQVCWKATGQIPSFAIQKAVQKELTAKGLVLSEQSRLGSANVLMYRLTEAGWRFLNRQPPGNTGGGSIAHQSISQWITMEGNRQKQKSRCGSLVPGTDYVADAIRQVGPELWDAYEVVVTCSSNLLDHITMLSQSSQVRNIIIVCCQKKIAQNLQKQLASEPVVKSLGSRLRWELAESFLRRTFS